MKQANTFTRIAIFCKHPTPGKVKTRLAASIGEPEAAAIYKQLLDYTVDTAKSSGLPVSLWISPSDQKDWFQSHYPDVEILCQCDGHLGKRLQLAATTHHQRGEAWIFLGSDCPTLTEHDLVDTSKALQSHDVVIGPSQDGGYWMVAGKQPHPELWTDMPWSEPTLFQATIDVINHHNHRHLSMRQQSDMDTLEDLRRLQKSGKLPSEFNQWSHL